MERHVEGRRRRHVGVGSGAYEGPYTYASRFESGRGTNPEELVGAAHAGCFSMFLAALLTTAGYTPTRVTTTAVVHLEAGPTITVIELNTEVEVPGLDRRGTPEARRGRQAGLPGIEGAGRAGDPAERETGEVGRCGLRASAYVRPQPDPFILAVGRRRHAASGMASAEGSGA